MSETTKGRAGRRRSRGSVSAGAEFRVELSKYGNTELRKEWAARADNLATLDEAVKTLMDYRAEHFGPTSDQDSLWIEARLEERVAVLRLQAVKSDEEFTNRTLTGEDARDVCARVLAQADAAGSDYREIERINDEFRLRYRPPIMATNLFLPTERDLAEKLMKQRSLDWFGKTIDQLRSERSAVVQDKPAKVQELIAAMTA